MNITRKLTILAAATVLSIPLTVSAPKQAEAFFVLPVVAAVAMFSAMAGGVALGGLMNGAQEERLNGRNCKVQRGPTYSQETGRFDGGYAEYKNCY